MRELSSVGRLASLLGRELTFVADPTFLLSAQEWKNALGISEDGKEHILYYSLRSIKIQKERKKELEALAEKENSKIVVITPFSAPFSAKNVLSIIMNMDLLIFEYDCEIQNGRDGFISWNNSVCELW